MNGFIDITVHGLETEYTARCQCGWTGTESATVEWAEFDFRGHLAKAHTEEVAA